VSERQVADETGVELARPSTQRTADPLDAAQRHDGQPDDVTSDAALDPYELERAAQAQPMSRLALVGVVATITLALSYFVISWQMLNSPLVDAIGETAGGTLLALVLISFVGALLRANRRAPRR
jgi:hypothetical protein